MSFSVKESARYLGYSEQYIRTLIRNGKLLAEKSGTVWVIPEHAVRLLREGNKSDRTSIPDNTNKNPAFSGANCLSFFSGAMGLDLGLEMAGFNTRLACEVDRASRNTIAKNKPDIALIGDIRNYTSSEILKAAGLKADEVDLIVGGPPCQAFSSAGKRQGFNDERGNVFLTFIDRILDIRPKFAVLENVRGLLSAPIEHTPHNQRDMHYGVAGNEVRGGALAHILRKLTDGGYGVSFNLYNAANFGSPQTRERLILVCSRDGEELPFLYPTHSATEEFGLKAWVTLKQAIGEIENRSHDHVKFPEKRLEYYRLLKSGQNWRNLPDKLQRQALGKSYFLGGGKTGFYRRLSWDKPCPTLVTHPAMPATDLCHPSQLRPLSVQEYKRIQEFPDHWTICGGVIDQYKQIGNAVPVSLGFAVGKLIRDKLLDQNELPPEGFRFSRYRNTSHTEWLNEYHKSLGNNVPQNLLSI